VINFTLKSVACLTAARVVVILVALRAETQLQLRMVRQRVRRGATVGFACATQLATRVMIV
jgi:hypothetical protein